MSYKSPAHSHISLNMTPLIDIVFLLLVFFMLTAHFVEEQQIDLTLPEAENAEALSDSEPVIVKIDSAGSFYINEQVVHSDLLELRLRAMFTGSPESTLQLKADARASFERVVIVLDILRKLEITQIEIATLKP